MTPHLSALGFTLIHFCWQAALIAGLYKLVEVCAPKLRNPERYLLGLVAMVAMLVAAVATFVYEDIRLSAEPAVVALAPAGAAQPDGNLTMQGLLPWLDGAWLLGVVVLSLRMMGGLWFIHRLQAAAETVPEAVTRRFAVLMRHAGLKDVRIRLHAAIDGPFVVGVWRAIVYLPVSAVTRLSPDQLDAVLAHELEHIRRADYLWNLMQSAVETLFFFHPAVWWLGGRLRDQRELCCDDAAVTMCRDPLTYATALLHLEEQRRVRPRLAVALNGQGSGKTLVSRIARVLGEGSDGTPRKRPSAAYALPAVALVLAAFLAPGAQVAARQATALATGDESAAALMDDATASSVAGSVHTPDAAGVAARAVAMKSSDIARSVKDATRQAKDVADAWNWTYGDAWTKTNADWSKVNDTWSKVNDAQVAEALRTVAVISDTDRARMQSDADAAARQAMDAQADAVQDQRIVRDLVPPAAPEAPAAPPAPAARPAPAAAPEPPEAPDAPMPAPRAQPAPAAAPAPPAAPAPAAKAVPAPPAPPAPYVSAAAHYKLTAVSYKTVTVKAVKVKQDITVAASVAPKILMSLPGSTMTPVSAAANADVVVHVNINVPAQKIRVPVYKVE